MNERISTPSAEWYFEVYGRNGIGRGADRMMVRSQLIDAFRKEIFGTVAMRAKKTFDEIPKEGDPEAMRIARNVIKDVTRKWIKLVKMFEQYKETAGLLKYEDITIDEDAEARIKNMDDNGTTNPGGQNKI